MRCQGPWQRHLSRTSTRIVHPRTLNILKMYTYIKTNIILLTINTMFIYIEGKGCFCNIKVKSQSQILLSCLVFPHSKFVSAQRTIFLFLHNLSMPEALRGKTVSFKRKFWYRPRGSNPSPACGGEIDKLPNLFFGYNDYEYFLNTISTKYPSMQLRRFGALPGSLFFLWGHLKTREF